MSQDESKQPSSMPSAELQAKMRLVAMMKKQNENWLMTLEIWDHQAKTMKAKYDAAISQGFTETQALFLCTQSWSH